MSADDDDYLSDKFLAVEEPTTSKKPRTYAELRKDALIKSQRKNEQNRIKKRHEREQEAREEGLSTSLFEKAKQEEEAGIGQNKALAMMMKMGYKPGESLGQKEEKHRAEPLPLAEWSGKQGIGVKRGASPSAAERIAKMAKMATETDHRDYRERARDEYKNRQAQGRLGPAQRTCATLDEQMGKTFNVLWLNPDNESSFPPGLAEALGEISDVGNDVASRLRRQMRADALVPLEETSQSLDTTEYPEELLKEAEQFLRLQAQDRLELLLSYLRQRHIYCFWCGVQYGDAEEMEQECPGETEDDHD